MKTPWPELKYWNCGEWQVVEERLNDLSRKGGIFCPGRNNLFRPLAMVKPEDVKVMFVGQDPYPNPSLATGIAFSIPENIKSEGFPPSLRTIFQEYVDDLHYPYPTSGDLEPWVHDGVLLWNAYPSCEAWRSLSHRWPEWELLTIELIQKLSEEAIFVFCGAVARQFAKFVEGYGTTNVNTVIEVSHPSPRGNLNAKHPFSGSRIFSTINAELVAQGKHPIDWRL